MITTRQKGINTFQALNQQYGFTHIIPNHNQGIIKFTYMSYIFYFRTSKQDLRMAGDIDFIYTKPYTILETIKNSIDI